MWRRRLHTRHGAVEVASLVSGMARVVAGQGRGESGPRMVLLLFVHLGYVLRVLLGRCHVAMGHKVSWSWGGSGLIVTY